jgi:two-component system copper resistance phosphate regulon response regulator CusR
MKPKLPAAACVTADPRVRAFLLTSLKGVRLSFYASAGAFLKAAGPGLAVIDGVLPDMSGRDLVAVLRGARKTARALLVLTGAGPYSPAAAALCFDNGADEYFTFPPEAGLFRARLLNLLARGGPRRRTQAAPAEYRFGALSVSPEARAAALDGRPLRLTALEFDILMYFLRNQGRVVSRGVLLEQVWRQGQQAGPRSVDKRIEALRARLGPKFASKIRTVFGLGYIFKLGR